MVVMSQLDWLGKGVKAAKVANSDTVTGFGQVGNVGGSSGSVGCRSQGARVGGATSDGQYLALHWCLEAADDRQTGVAQHDRQITGTQDDVAGAFARAEERDVRSIKPSHQPISCKQIVQCDTFDRIVDRSCSMNIA